MRGVSDDDATRTARRVRAAGWLLGSCCLLAVFLALTAPAAAAGTSVANVSEASGGSLLPASVAGVLGGLPNPLALWPGGLVGTVLGALVGLVAVVYGVLKALAIYLGY